MQQDFETTMNEFLAKVKSHFETREATLAEYEQFFNRAQELFPAYSGFVQHVNDALTSISAAIAEQQNDAHTRSTPAPKKSQQITKFSTHETKKVLIVDDAEINRVLMSHLFKSLPIKLEFANCGNQALEKLAQQSFDLILMDLQMKDMSGLDTIKAIRAAHPESGAPTKTLIVAITNLEPSEDERTQTINAGASEYLSKSMPREAVREKVAELLFGAQSISA